MSNCKDLYDQECVRLDNEKTIKCLEKCMPKIKDLHGKIAQAHNDIYPEQDPLEYEKEEEVGEGVEEGVEESGALGG